MQDEGYNSFSVGRNKIESALETLCSKRNEFYDTSIDCSKDSEKEDFRSWDEIFDTVERFSHNTTTLLSWVEEFKEVQHMKFDTNRDKRPPIDCWNDSVLGHIYRVYKEVETDGEMLLKDFLQEQKLVSLILKNVSEEYEHIAAGWCGAMRDPTTENKSVDEKDEKTKATDSLLSYDNNKSEHCFREDGQRIKLWRIFIREREEAFTWMNDIRRKIDTLQTYYPKKRLHSSYEKYLIEVREEKSFKNSLKIIYDFISESFPELRFRLKALVNETNQAQVDLEDYIIKKIAGLSATNKSKQASTHQHKTQNQKNELTSLKRKQTSLNKDAETKITIKAKNITTDNESLNINSNVFSEKTLQLHQWLKNRELEAIKLFSSKPIGWNPDILAAFLSKNKGMQDEIAEYKIMLKALEHEAKNKLNKATNSDATNLQWMLLMFRQRISTLSMFCLDVQCLIERRVDVTKLLSQNINIDELHHPVDDVWSELAVKLTKDDLTVDKDYSF